MDGCIHTCMHACIHGGIRHIARSHMTMDFRSHMRKFACTTIHHVSNLSKKRQDLYTHCNYLAQKMLSAQKGFTQLSATYNLELGSGWTMALLTMSQAPKPLNTSAARLFWFTTPVIMMKRPQGALFSDIIKCCIGSRPWNLKCTEASRDPCWSRDHFPCHPESPTGILLVTKRTSPSALSHNWWIKPFKISK